MTSLPSSTSGVVKSSMSSIELLTSDFLRQALFVETTLTFIP